MTSSEVAEGFRLSPQQRWLWLLQQDGSAYRAQCAIMIEGRLDSEVLSSAVRQIINRHEILRTTFRREPGIRTPVQVIGSCPTWPTRREGKLCAYLWQREDLSEFNEHEQAAKIKELFGRDGILPFDFERGPLVRLSLIVLSPHRHLLSLCLPSLCADGPTLKYLYEELCRTYSGGSPVEAMQYADVADWQNELLQVENANSGRKYWQQRSGLQLFSAAIPFELRPSSEEKFEPARFVRDNDSALTARLEAFARKYDTHVATILQACWQTLMWRLTRQSTIVVGRVFEGRNYEELKGALGLMGRCVPVSCRFDDNASFEEVLRAVGRNAQEADQWQESWTYDGLNREMQVQYAEAERATQPNYCSVSFEYQERGRSYAAADVQFSIFDQFACFDRYKLKLVCARGGESRLAREFHYDPRFIAASAVTLLADQFQQAVESALDNPRGLVSELCILSDRERHRLLVEVNQTDREYGPDKPIHQLFEEQAASAPERIAVVYESSQVSYGELNARANQLAHYLQELGVGPETAVVLYVERSVAMMIGLLGILKAGGAYVPLDGAQPRHRLAAILEEVDSPVVVTQASLKEHLVSSGKPLVCLDSDWEAVSSQSVENPPTLVSGENLVYIIYTSGSTGKPNGVAVEHRQLANYFYAIKERLSVPDGASYATVSTFAADLGNTMIYLAIGTGGELHILSPQRVTDVAAMNSYCSQHQINYLKIVPSHLEALLDHGKPAALLPGKCLIVGGEASRWKLIDLVRQSAPLCDIYNHYGPTETTIGVLTCQATEKASARQAEMVALGQPLGNTQVYVLDHQMKVVTTGETGEIYIGGAQVARGYLKQTERTAERFVPNPFGRQVGERLYRTSDLGRFLPSGEVEFVGRGDNQVKLRGHRIELSGIRSVLNRHPQITDSVVVINKDKNDQQHMVAYYLARERIEINQLRSFLAEHIIEQTIPSFLIELQKFPLTPNGKIDLQALSTDDKLRPGSTHALIAPRTPMEEMLAGLWTRLLGVQQISIDDNFFTLGGHSLLATRVVSELQRSLQVEVPFKILFDSPTVAAMAESLEALVKEGKGVQSPAIVRVSREQELPLSFAQQRLWFIDQLEPNSSGYNSTSAVRLAGTLDLAALRRTFNEIVRRHEVLRTTFAVVDGRPVQLISGERQVALPVIELPEAGQAEVLRFANEDSLRPFDLAVGPLVRMSVLRLGPKEHVLVVTMHHIISDAWSNGVVMREVSALYQAFIDNRPSPLLELPVQYADFAVWQRQWLQGEALDMHLAYWKSQLSGNLPMLELPSDRPRPEVRTYNGGKHVVRFSQRLSEELRALSQRNGVTLFMTLLAVFQILLRFYTKQDDIIVGTDVANRNRAETEGLIGFFINQLALRTRVSGNPSFSELLGRVREVTLGAYAHQDLPFDKLVEALKPERSLKYSPFFQVKFVLENVPMTRLELPGLAITPLEIESIGAKLDLTPLLRDGPDGIHGWIEYNRDLFDASTVARFAEYFETLLRQIVDQPEARISELEGPLVELENLRVAREQKERLEAQRNKFKSIKPQTITLPEEVLVKTEYFAPGEKLPLILRPMNDGIELVDWSRANRDLIEAELLKHGAILFRGFQIGSAARFEQFASTLCPDLFNENGEHPRQSISGNVYTPVFYPPDQKLLWHNENSFNNRWPMKIWFCCVRPASEGGETLLVDSKKVFEEIDPQIRERFIQKKVMYVRNYQNGLGLDWQAVFQTTDKAEVEQRCRQDGIEFHWKSADRLCTRSVRPAAAKHPQTGAWVWFNQAQHWHVSRLDAKTRESLISLFAEEDLPRNCYYGDGTPIEDSVMDEICAVYRKLEVCFPWEAGDIIMLDNMLTAHGRNPFVGERKLLVALGEMLRYADLTADG
jgi:amino acid adenylation domain-containing protein